MSRRKTKSEEIIDCERYFNKYVAMEVKHDLQETHDYYAMFSSLDQIMEAEEDGNTGKKERESVLEDHRDNFLSKTECKSADEWMAEMENEALCRALHKLSCRQRLILFLRYYRKLTYREIEEIVGISYQVVERTEKKAIKNLREIMARG